MWLAIFSGILMGVSFIQIWFLTRADKNTAVQTLQAGKIAGRQSRDTRDAIESAADAAERQANDTRILQRAYIGVEPLGVSPFEGTAGFLCVAHVGIHNAGNLPAGHVRWAVRVHFDLSAEWTTAVIQDADVDADNLVVAKGTMVQGSKPFEFVGADLIEVRRHFLYVYGAVRYLDGFHKVRTTLFCHRYNCANLNRSRPLEGQGLPADKARYHRNGNDAD